MSTTPTTPEFESESIEELKLRLAERAGAVRFEDGRWAYFDDDARPGVLAARRGLFALISEEMLALAEAASDAEFIVEATADPDTQIVTVAVSHRPSGLEVTGGGRDFASVLDDNPILEMTRVVSARIAHGREQQTWRARARQPTTAPTALSISESETGDVWITFHHVNTQATEKYYLSSKVFTGGEANYELKASPDDDAE